MKTSITIFNNTLNYQDSSSQVETPAEVLEAVKRVMARKTTEVVKTQQGFFVVEHSDTGPFVENLLSERVNWLPVRISRIQKWQSGGITQDEFKEWLLQRVASE